MKITQYVNNKICNQANTTTNEMGSQNIICINLHGKS